MQMNLTFNSKEKIALFILASALIIAGILVFYDPQASKKSLADLKNEKEVDFLVGDLELMKEYLNEKKEKARTRTESDIRG